MGFLTAKLVIFTLLNESTGSSPTSAFTLLRGHKLQFVKVLPAELTLTLCLGLFGMCTCTYAESAFTLWQSCPVGACVLTAESALTLSRGCPMEMLGMLCIILDIICRGKVVAVSCKNQRISKFTFVCKSQFSTCFSVCKMSIKLAV